MPQNARLILTHPATPTPPRQPGVVDVLWNSWECGDNVLSLPALLAKDLLCIRDEHATWAYTLGQTTVLGKSIADHLTLDDNLSFWWLSLLYERHPKMTPMLYTIYRLRALERYLDEIGAQALTLCGGDATLAHVLRDFCQTSGRAFTWEKGEKGEEGEKGKKSSETHVSWTKRVYAHLPADLRVLVRALIWYVRIRRPLGDPDLPARAAGETATIATYFPNIDAKAAEEGRFRSRYWEDLHDLLETLANPPNVRWLFVHFPDPKRSFRECIALRDRFRAKQRDGLSFTYLEEFLSKGAILRCIRRFVTLRQRSLALEAHIPALFTFPSSQLNFYPYAKDDWIESFRGWRALERILCNEAMQTYVQRVGPQRWTLFPLENCPWERMLTHAVHTAKHGPVIGAQHSSIRPTDFRYFDDPRVFAKESPVPVPDTIVANGQSALAQWTASGVPQNKLRMAEALRYLYLARTQHAKHPPVTKTILVLTSFFADETRAHMRLFTLGLERNSFDGWTCLVKPHPYLDPSPYLPKPLPTHVRLVSGPIADYLIPGTLVWAANSTTAALEAALMGLAIAVMQPENDFDLCPIQDIPGLFRTATGDDVQRMLIEAHPLDIPANYLDLSPDLAAWRDLLRVSKETSAQKFPSP